MLSRGFSKHITRNPISDDEILAALDWIENMCQSIRDRAQMEIVEVSA